MSSAFTMRPTISFPQSKSISFPKSKGVSFPQNESVLISMPKLKVHQGRGLVMATKAYGKAPNGFRINPSFKVALLGISHGICPVLASELKTSPLISTLRQYSVEDFDPLDATRRKDHLIGLDETLKDIDVVVIVGRFPTLSPNYFNANATIVSFFINAVADRCPGAIILIANDELNSIIPMAAEVLKQKTMYNPEKLLGVMTPEVELARSIIAEVYGRDVKHVDVPIIGGHSIFSCLPLFSKIKPELFLTDMEIMWLVKETHYRMKQDSFTLEYFEEVGIVRFVLSLLRALDGDENVFECCFVESKVVRDLPFFASTVKLGQMGLEAVIEPNLEGLRKYEAETLKGLRYEIDEDIDKGILFAIANKTPEA